MRLSLEKLKRYQPRLNVTQWQTFLYLMGALQIMMNNVDDTQPQALFTLNVNVTGGRADEHLVRTLERAFSRLYARPKRQEGIGPAVTLVFNVAVPANTPSLDKFLEYRDELAVPQWESFLFLMGAVETQFTSTPPSETAVTCTVNIHGKGGPRHHQLVEAVERASSALFTDPRVQFSVQCRTIINAPASTSV